MKRIHVAAAVAAGIVLVAVATRPARAQEWRPPSKSMPAMPAADAMGGNWAGSQSAWLLPGAAAERATAEGIRGGKAGFVRFVGGVRPVATWADRNGDGRADMVELFRDGARTVQLLDADYDGSADVMRVYGASGELVREERI